MTADEIQVLIDAANDKLHLGLIGDFLVKYFPEFL